MASGSQKDDDADDDDKNETQPKDDDEIELDPDTEMRDFALSVCVLLAVGGRKKRLHNHSVGPFFFQFCFRERANLFLLSILLPAPKTHTQSAFNSALISGSKSRASRKNAPSDQQQHQQQQCARANFARRWLKLRTFVYSSHFVRILLSLSHSFALTLSLSLSCH